MSNMDASITIPPEVFATLSDPTLSPRENGVVLRDCYRQKVAVASAAATGELQNTDVFNLSLQVKLKLDALEAASFANNTTSFGNTIFMMNCEYQLYDLNKATPLRWNPFLSHWVEAAQRYQEKLKEFPPDSDVWKYGEDFRKSVLIRIELIRRILNLDSSLSNASRPSYAFRDILHSQCQAEFPLEPFITILEEEGVYERSENDTKRAQEQNLDRAMLAPALQGSNPEMQETGVVPTDRLLQVINTNNTSVEDINLLVHLPIELSVLEALTNLLMGDTLEKLGLDPAKIIQEYLNHSLRQLERMGNRPAAADSPELLGEDNAEYGRGVQSRAVKLLVLFMTNVVHKSLVPPHELFFQIQEICVRYMWIPEVRKFRSLVESKTTLDENEWLAQNG